ncbi:MAG: hypothetical protein IT423_05350, partial [Pirellulaceae bacterium]|nr:hypothetical protein [Pirellulaceae bacterium]
MRSISMLPAVLSIGLTGLMWLMGTLAQADQMPPKGPFVHGYASAVSIAQGESIGLHLSSSSPKVSIVIERVGGTRQKVWEQTDVATSVQTIPDRASSDGCKWPETVKVPTTDQWPSGYYVASLSAQQDGQAAKGSLFFIVRQQTPGSHSKILLQLSTNTYNAYTNWGGHSLYGYHDRDGIQGHRVSFDR